MNGPLLGYYLVHAVPQKDYAIKMPGFKESLLECSHRCNNSIFPEIPNTDIPQDGNISQLTAEMGCVLGRITRGIGIDISFIKLLDNKPEYSSILTVECYHRELISIPVYMLSSFKARYRIRYPEHARIFNRKT